MGVRPAGVDGPATDVVEAGHRPARIWTENRPSRGGLVLPRPAELLRYRELAFILALRDLQVRYKQTFFGVAWALLQPLAGAIVFAVVFGRVVGVTSEGIPYLVFAYAGMLVWTYVSSALEAAANSLVANEALVTKIYFPRLLAPLAAVLPGLVDLALASVVLAVLCLAYGVGPGAAVLAAPVVLVAAVLLAFGVGSLLAAVNVRYRDVRHALGFLLQLWFYASPVAYPSSLVTGWAAYVYALNPVVGLLDAFRWATVGASAPDRHDVVSLAVGVLLTIAGVLYFARAERRFADVI